MLDDQDSNQKFESSGHSQHLQLELHEESEEEGRLLNEGQVCEDHDQFADINNDDDLNRAIVLSNNQGSDDSSLGVESTPEQLVSIVGSFG